MELEIVVGVVLDKVVEKLGRIMGRRDDEIDGYLEEVGWYYDEGVLRMLWRLEFWMGLGWWLLDKRDRVMEDGSKSWEMMRKY